MFLCFLFLFSSCSSSSLYVFRFWVSFIFLVSLVFSSSFLICFARQRHHLVFFLLLVMWHELSTLTWHWSPPHCWGADEVSWDVTVAGDYHTYCGFRSLDTHVTVSCCTNTPPGFLFFQNLSMLRLDFLLSCLLICLPDQTFYNLYIIRSYFQFFSVLIKFVSRRKFYVLMDI